MSDLDKELYKIIFHVAVRGRGKKQDDDYVTQTVEKFKRSFAQHVVGEDEVFIDIPILDHTGKVESVIDGRTFTPYMLMRNSLRREQRQKLWNKPTDKEKN